MEIAGHLPIGATSTCSVVEDNVLLHPQSDSSVLELTDEVVCQLQTYYAENKGDETKVLAEIAQYAVRKKHLTYFDHHNRKVKLSATESEIQQSNCRSSYVATTDVEERKVGCIISLFEHEHLSQKTTFAFVSWFDGPITDRDSQLSFVLTTDQYRLCMMLISTH